MKTMKIMQAHQGEHLQKKDKNSTGDSAGSSRGYGGHIGGRCPRRLWLMSGILLPPNSSFDQGLLLI